MRTEERERESWDEYVCAQKPDGQEVGICLIIVVVMKRLD